MLFLGQAQVDAAAKVVDDGERCGGGGVRAKERLREKEEEE